MALPTIYGEFVVVHEPELRFSNNGNAWAKVRAVAKDRVRDQNGGWTDGDPLFIDIIIGNGAQNLVESVSKGDTIQIAGKLKMRQYDHNGETRTGFSITADQAAVSVRWGTARTQKTVDAMKPGAQAAIDILGAEALPSEDSEPPF